MIGETRRVGVVILDSLIGFVVQHQTSSLPIELRGKHTSLLVHQTPLHGEHSRLNPCPDTLNRYNALCGRENSREPGAKAQARQVASLLVHYALDRGDVVGELARQLRRDFPS